ncbi:O-methyltransferase [Nigerium massiliense]|uniref:O-methyltransferase n=1 Tax=Nigerium massiliense TaxID=1522317 RepID=UPI00058DEC61|nr:O-methyltransferase [Nigerium massiliense]
MTSTPSTVGAPSAASWQFAEQFVPEDEYAQAARRAGQELGVTSASQGEAAVLTLLARILDAKAAVEIGTGAGVSGLALLRGMNPEGILTSIDLENEHQTQARRVFTSAGIVPRRARLIAGPGLGVLPKLSDAAYDLVFADGDPLEFVEYVAQAARLLRSGGLLVVGHALAGGAVADSSNEDDETVIIRETLDAVTEMEEFTPLLLPVGDGLLVATRA